MSLDSRNDDLNRRIADSDLPSAVETLIKDAGKRRRQVRWLAVSLLLDILLTFGLAFVSFYTHKTAVKADDNQAALVRNCETSNDARDNNKKLWGYILAIPPAEPLTPERQKIRDDFQGFVDMTFAHRDCSTIVEK